MKASHPGHRLRGVGRRYGSEYRLAYPCVWRDGAWYGIGKTNPVAIRVIGWCIDVPRKKPAMPERG